MFPPLLIQLLVCLLLLISILKVEVAQAAAPLARPGCKDTCGSVRIPYPFGIGPNCFLDPWYGIECKASPNSNGSTKPFLSKLNIEVMEVTLPNNDDVTQKLTVRIPPLNVCSADTQHHQQLSSIDLRESPYYFSAAYNALVMEGCPGSTILVDELKEILAGCGTVCHHNTSAVSTNTCYGVQCCQAPMFSTVPFYQMDFNHQTSGEHQSCLVATLIKNDSVNEYAGKLSTSDPSFGVPVVLAWFWMSGYLPDNNTHAYCNSDGPNINYCKCIENSYGNPYVFNGCQVPKECKHCHGYCAPDGRNSYYCDGPRFTLAAILGYSISFGIALLLIALYVLYRFIKRRREMMRSAKFFKRNGGLLLQQQLSSNEGVVERTKIFTIGQLDKATDHFNENRVLGQGGQGKVYKGMLSDGSIVAIKKSKLVDESQLEQFVNEVVILSHLNHRNVVKLLGCCLETEVPLLVYEFIPNGTLSQHIHDPDEDFVISWDMRLKIAADSAGAVAYLHSSSSVRIYHRDIKSSNILLDEKHRAKVSDFGSSRTIAIDQTHLSTLVQGTIGYLDPEYFQSYQFTEKSDVYSFGVVLLELLTGKKPIYRAETMEQKNLVTEFLYMFQNSNLPDILDPQIVKEAKEEELIAVAKLAKCCLRWNGKMRPTMKEVAMTLEMIIKSPANVSNFDEQDFPNEEFDENAMSEISDAEFMSNH